MWQATILSIVNKFSYIWSLIKGVILQPYGLKVMIWYLITLNGMMPSWSKSCGTILSNAILESQHVQQQITRYIKDDNKIIEVFDRILGIHHTILFISWYES